MSEPNHGDTTRVLSIRQVIVRITLIITAIEAAVMVLLEVMFSGHHAWEETLFDAVLLAAISIPCIYAWVVQPFVAAHNRLLNEVTHLAYHDPLTRLSNRRLLVEQLDRALAAYRRNPAYGALLLIDLDGFKAINDHDGHEVGDLVLCVTAQRLHAVTRGEDLVSRMGGDEFLVLLQRLSADPVSAEHKAVEAAYKLVAAIGETMEIGGRELKVGARVGVRLLGPDSTNSESVIRDADQAMYRIKAKGRSDVGVFETPAT
ncbi:hypothetical protein BJI67_12710 [Acidihalobacter aeolianus]|uniref:GGDEF domain-containing protein n=1 Tax=Acidihalobacter aeolianus TaxID=2792603 RepID=A0A1D8KA18_9GAMM|nr:hypothetical protein BJI67_12710 [Acidihalobacter aeolianus]